MSLDGNMHIKKGELNMCTNNENQIKAVLGKRIYEILKLEYLESLRSYIKTHKSVNLALINPTVKIPLDLRIDNVVIDGIVLNVTREYLNMNGLDFTVTNGNDGYLHFSLSSLEAEKINKKTK